MDEAVIPPRVLVTAGPTHEPIDSVRYIANRSSGRMGLALTNASVERAWPTTLLLGPTALQPIDHSLLRIHRFQTTTDLQALLREHWPSHDVLIMAAAVADYRPIAHSGKIKRGGPMALQLEPTPDLLAELAGSTRPDQCVIGFALEPAERLMSSARDKLDRKHLNAIVANPLETMDSKTVTAKVILRGDRVLSPQSHLRKEQFADWLLDRLPEIAATERTVAK